MPVPRGGVLEASADNHIPRDIAQAMRSTAAIALMESNRPQPIA